MIPDMLSNQNFNPIVTELFINWQKLNTSIVFITQFFFQVPQEVILNLKFRLKLNKWQFTKIESNHSSVIDSEEIMNLYKKYTVKTYSFSVIDTTLASNDPLSFKHNIL